MREFKFRSWDEENKRMLSWERLRAIYPISCLYIHPDKTWVPMQYTGLKDSNGKEIYEGDIVEFLVDRKIYDGVKIFRSKVIFEDGAFLIKEDPNDYDTFLCAFTTKNSYIEVIGNNYENPELLEG